MTFVPLKASRRSPATQWTRERLAKFSDLELANGIKVLLEPRPYEDQVEVSFQRPHQACRLGEQNVQTNRSRSLLSADPTVDA